MKSKDISSAKLQQSSEVENQIPEQHKRLRLLQAGFNHIKDMVVISKAPVVDPLNSSIVLVNQAFEDFTGYSSAEVMGKCPSFLLGEKTDPAIIKELNENIQKNKHARVEFINYKKDGSTYWVDLEMSPFPAEEDDMLYWAGINRDISEQVKHRDALEKSLHEKDTLLAEVHHRVKNNLAVISGLLEMQSFNADNEEIAGALQESQSRIQSIATVHEILYQSDSFANIELATYIDELVSYIAGTFNHDGTNIRFKKDVESISLTVKQAVPCGLLLNELITNAYKHAFRDLDKGTIVISMKRNKNTIQLEVRDDGIGLPKDLNAEKPSSLGMKLIKTLVRQLEGSLTIERKPATAFKVLFEKEDLSEDDD
jgi:PAS domain S-box-containing protein